MQEGSSPGTALTTSHCWICLPSSHAGSLLVAEHRVLAAFLLPISGSSQSLQALVLPPALKGHPGSQSLRVDPELAGPPALVCPVPAQGLGSAEQHLLKGGCVLLHSHVAFSSRWG